MFVQRTLSALQTQIAEVRECLQNTKQEVNDGKWKRKKERKRETFSNCDCLENDCVLMHIWGRLFVSCFPSSWVCEAEWVSMFCFGFVVILKHFAFLHRQNCIFLVFPRGRGEGKTRRISVHFICFSIKRKEGEASLACSREQPIKGWTWHSEERCQWRRFSRWRVATICDWRR